MALEARLARLLMPFAFALAVLQGCGGGGGGGGDAEAGCRARLPVSASVVNGWPGLDPVAYAKLHSASCLSLVGIEGLPWVDRSGPCDSRHPALCTNPFPAERRAFFAAMKAEGVSVFVNVENANAYGPRVKSRQWYGELVQAIAADAAATGADVWLSPISEPWAWDSSEPRARAELAASIWPGTFVLPDAGANRRSGRPYWSGIPYDLLEVHPCTWERAREALAPTTLTVTDCGPTLNPGPSLAVELGALALERGAPLVFYDHGATAADAVTLEALGTLVE